MKKKQLAGKEEEEEEDVYAKTAGYVDYARCELRLPLDQVLFKFFRQTLPQKRRWLATTTDHQKAIQSGLSSKTWKLNRFSIQVQTHADHRRTQIFLSALSQKGYRSESEA